MAKITLTAALDAVEITYHELNQLATEITKEFLDPVEALVNKIRSDINNLTNDQIRNYMIQLALTSFSLGEIKEKSSLKAECAEALKKEALAKHYAEAEGTSAAKDNIAVLNSTSEIVSEALFSLVANLFKTKLDSIHRLIDVMKSVLMTRNQEAKLTNNVVD